MVSGKSPESLPPGFTENIKYKNGRKIKYYYNAAMGTKYFSKKELICATTDNGPLDTPQTKNGDDNGWLCSNKNADAMLARTNDTLEWLPEGWIMEEKRRQSGSSKGSSYKNATGCPVEGNELLSTPRTTNGDDDLSSDKKVDAMVVKANDTPEWLPEGWTMEEKIRQSGPTKGTTYKIYIDSSSGKKLYSRAAVTQYLNNVGPSHAMVVQNEVSVKTNDFSQWLPEGWIVEEKTRQGGSAKGSTYKVYIESSSGKRFYSRNAATQYLNTINHRHTSTVQNEKDAIDCGTANDQLIATPLTTYGDDNVCSTDKFVGLSFENTDFSQWLPDGWEVEEKTRQSGLGKGSTYKVYIEWSSGSKFYSKAAVTRYLNTVHHADSMPAQKNTNSSVKSCPVVSPQGISKTSSGHVSEKKNQSNSNTITTEITTSDDLPPGWTKEIRTSKSGSKIRRDPFYTDPISGYTFRSKLDALRYLKTNDIRSCACKPFKREPDDLMLISSDIPASNASDESSSKKKGQLFLGGESYGGGTSGMKSRAKSKAKPSKQAEGSDVLNHEALVANRLATKHRFSSSWVGAGKPANASSVNSKKSKKRRDSELPSRTSKRLSNESSMNMADIELDNASEKFHLEKLEDPSDSKKSPESQLGYDFGESWADPVEFALKTLCGEMLAEDNLPLPDILNEGLLSKPLGGCSKPVQQSDETVNFTSESVPSTEPLKIHGALALLQSNLTFSDTGDVSFNGQSSTEGWKDGQLNSVGSKRDETGKVD